MKLAALRRLTKIASREERAAFARAFNEKLDALGVEGGQAFILGTRGSIEFVPKPIPGACVFCHEPVDVKTAANYVQGWVFPRDQGGANALALRESHPDTFACRACIDRQKRGIAPGQQSFAA